MDAMVGSIDGKRTVRGSIRGAAKDSEKLGTALARELLSKGADKILAEIRMSEAK